MVSFSLPRTIDIDTACEYAVTPGDVETTRSLLRFVPAEIGSFR